MTADKVLSCFKTYDVRGRLGEEMNQDIAYRIGRAVAQSVAAKTVVVGFDARATSPSFAQAVAKGVCESSSDVIEIGLSGTEEIYSAVSEFKANAGIEITASHNPIDYNGLKIVKHGAQPLSEYEFAKIRQLAQENNFSTSQSNGSVINKQRAARESYLKKILGFVAIENLKPLKIVINSGNGAAGPVIDAIKSGLEARGVETNFVFVNHNPDPSFPNGIPNPLLEKNRSSTSDSVTEEKADFGVAFDGDFDRCFLFDHLGNFISGEYIVGLLAEVFLKKNKRSTIIHDPRVIWNTLDIVSKFHGFAVASKTGHAFVKKAMREKDAIYGGEMSAHHYFKDFHFCDSGMIPWLMVWQLLSQKNRTLADLILERKNQFLSSGELNFIVDDALKCLQKVKKTYAKYAIVIDELDGLSLSFGSWRFNLRKSNTEPLVRLNVETRGDGLLMRKKTKELTDLILKP